MDNKKVERKLKNGAKKIIMKDFDERWETIRNQIDAQKETVIIPQAIPVLAEEGGERKGKPRYRTTLITTIVVLFCVLTLAISLPLLLAPNANRTYFNESDLQQYITNENEFYERLNESNISIIDLSHIAIESYSLYVTPENEVRGGIIEFTNAEKEYFVHIRFYDEYVQGTAQDTVEYSDYNLHDIIIRYKIDSEGEEYNTVAITQYHKINYYIEILSLSDNMSEIFLDLFKQV